MEIGKVQIVNEQLEQENTKLQEEICLLKDQVSYLTHQCNLSSQSALVAQQQMLSVQTTQQERPEISALSLKGDDKRYVFTLVYQTTMFLKPFIDFWSHFFQKRARRAEFNYSMSFCWC